MVDHNESACDRARKALGFPPDRPIDDLALSVFLKYLLVAHLEARERRVESFRRLSQEARRGGLAKLAETAGRDVRPVATAACRQIGRDGRFAVSGAILDGIPGDDRYLGRIAQLAVEQFTSERLSPELCIAPRPLPQAELKEALQGRVDYAVLFDAFQNFTNEMYPLAVDAFESDLEAAGVARTNVLGVHRAWWRDDGAVLRGIFLRQTDHRLVESDFDPTRTPSWIHSLCMSSRVHRLVSERAKRGGIPETNPYEPAARTADDKYECFRRWSLGGVPTPPAVLLPRDMPRERAIAALRRTVDEWEREDTSAGLVVQPNHGTEGQGALHFPAGSEAERVLEHVARVWESDDAIARREVGRSCLWAGEIPASRRGKGGQGCACDLRVNVAWSGAEWRAESGYLQVAGEPGDVISAVGRGGRIVRLSRGALDGLVVPKAEGLRQVAMTNQSLNQVFQVAVRAARAVGEMGLVGIDLRLAAAPDGPGIGLAPIVLDANPRPAGLSHSEFFPTSDRGPEPGVSRHMWLRFYAGKR